MKKYSKNREAISKLSPEQYRGPPRQPGNHHFRQITAMAPMQYQKRLRLHEARRLMLVDRLDVGSAGHRVGYQSPSQFSREYSRLYGLSPLRDVETVRERVSGDVLI
jgi:transcriptional regulator GlxA family with amidase domain